MSKRNFDDIVRIAKEATRINVDTDEGYGNFRSLAKREGVDHNSLMYYTNAYEAVDESGIKALSYRKRMPEDVRIKAVHKVNEFLMERIPKELSEKIGFQVEAKDNRITLAEKRPYFADKSRATCSEFAQLRYTDYDKRWHLYWMRASGKWWPYIPRRQVKTVNDCIREISHDTYGCFWG